MSFDWIYTCSETVTGFQDTTCMQDVLNEFDPSDPLPPLCGLDCQDLVLFYNTLAFWGVYWPQVPTQFLDLWIKTGGIPLEKGDAYAAHLNIDYTTTAYVNLGYQVKRDDRTTLAASIHACKHNDLHFLRYLYQYPGIDAYRDYLCVCSGTHGSLSCIIWLCSKRVIPLSQKPADDYVDLSIVDVLWNKGQIQLTDMQSSQKFQCKLIGATISISCLDWLRQNCHFWFCYYDIPFKTAIETANYAVMEWMHSHGYRYITSNYHPWYSVGSAFGVAAKTNNIPLLEWLLSQGYVMTTWSSFAACTGYHLASLKWLLAHDCPWNMSHCAERILFGELRYQPPETYPTIITGGAGDMLRFLHKSNCSWVDVMTNNLNPNPKCLLNWLAANGFRWFEAY